MTKLPSYAIILLYCCIIPYSKSNSDTTSHQIPDPHLLSSYKTNLTTLNSQLTLIHTRAETLTSNLTSLIQLYHSLLQRTKALNRRINEANKNEIQSKLTTPLTKTKRLVTDTISRDDIAMAFGIENDDDSTMNKSVWGGDWERQLANYTMMLGLDYMTELFKEDSRSLSSSSRKNDDDDDDDEPCITKQSGMEYIYHKLSIPPAVPTPLRVVYIDGVTSDTYEPPPPPSSSSSSSSSDNKLTLPLWISQSLGFSGRIPPPEELLNDDTSPGSCWPMKGRTGRVMFRFDERVAVEGVSLYHTTTRRSLDEGEKSSAPRSFRVTAEDGMELVKGEYDLRNGGEVQSFMVDGCGGEMTMNDDDDSDDESSESESSPGFLGGDDGNGMSCSFEGGEASCGGGGGATTTIPPPQPKEEKNVFEQQSCTMETMDSCGGGGDDDDDAVPTQQKSCRPDVVQVLTLHVDDNWGNEDYTCIYHFRVHGKVIGDE